MPKHPGQTINDPDYRYDLYYKDTGCHLAPKCLECPFADCLWELPRAEYEAQLRVLRLKAYQELRAEHKRLVDGGMSYRDAIVATAQRLGKSERATYRLVALGKG